MIDEKQFADLDDGTGRQRQQFAGLETAVIQLGSVHGSQILDLPLAIPNQAYVTPRYAVGRSCAMRGQVNVREPTGFAVCASDNKFHLQRHIQDLMIDGKFWRRQRGRVNWLGHAK